MRGGVSAEQTLEILTLLVGKDNGGCMGCRHGRSPMFEASLVVLLLVIRAPACPGYGKLPKDLRNAVLRVSGGTTTGQVAVVVGREAAVTQAGESVPVNR